MEKIKTKAGNSFQILSERAFEDEAKIVSKYGQEYVEGFQVDFSIEVTLKTGESRKFHIAYQSRDRSDKLRAYGSCEMSTAGKYGCDEDSEELMDFTGYDEEIIEILQGKAEKLCKEWFDNNVESED